MSMLVRDAASAPARYDLDPRPVRWTRSDFYRMVEAGILPEDATVELIGGEIVEKSPMNPPHAVGVIRVTEALRRIFRRGYYISPQLPLAVSEDSEPIPDLAVIAGRLEDHLDEHPVTAVLVVEVSDTSLRTDRTRKASLYASAGVPDYWVADLVNRRIEIFRDPIPMPEQPFGFGYNTVALAHPGERITPLGAPGASVPVRSLLPPVKLKRSHP